MDSPNIFLYVIILTVMTIQFPKIVGLLVIIGCITLPLCAVNYPRGRKFDFDQINF